VAPAIALKHLDQVPNLHFAQGVTRAAQRLSSPGR
jgi:hypothetical protein